MLCECLLQWGRNFFVTEILQDSPPRPRCPGFNGAVTFSLRKSNGNAGYLRGRAELQWGRNFFVTEIPNAITATLPLLILKLQWGRNFFVTEISNKQSVGQPSMTPLQWGRNFFVTEILRSSKGQSRSQNSFNGAVTFSLRKSKIETNDFIERFRFNGAVTFSLRKSTCIDSSPISLHLSFNGAVTFSLRKFLLS